MKVAALQTGSLFGDLLEVPASGQKTAQAVEGADFTAVLEEAGQALQAPAAKETSPVVAEILSTATAEARLAEETVLPRVQAPVIMPRSDRPLPVPEVRPTIISATGAEQPVEELVTMVSPPEQPLPRNGEGVRQPQHPETRGASRSHHPQPLARNDEEVIPQNVAPRDEARPTIPLVAEGKREASVKAGSTERQEKSVVAEEVVVAQIAPAVVIAAAGPSMTEVPTQRGEERTFPAKGLEKGETTDVLSRPVTAAAAPEAVRVAPPQQNVRRDETLEAVKAEVVKPEAVKAEVVKPETVKAEVVKPEVTKAEVVKTEAVKAEVARPEVVKAEVVKAEVARPEAVKAEVVKPETVRAEVVKAEGARPEAVKAEVVKPAVIKAEVVKPEMVKAEAVKPEAAPTATRFEVAQGVAGYREHAFAANLQKAPVAEVSVQAAPAVKEAVIVSAAPAANPVQEVTPILSGEKTDAVIPKAAVVQAEQGVVLSEKKQEAEAAIAVKPSAISGETVKQAQPETVTSSEPKTVVAQAAEAVRDPHRTVALRQQSPRQEKVEEQVEPISKSAIETGAAKPVVEVAVREKSGAEAGGEKKQNFPEGAPHKHLEGLQQPLDVNRPQFQPAEPVKPEMQETAKNPLHESILSQIRDKVETTNVDGNREVTVRLNPEELGELTINIRMDGRNVKVDVVAENATVKEALMENIDRLKETFSKQNMTMEQFDVSTGNGGRFQQQAQREQRAAHHAAWFGGSASPAHFAADEQKVAAYYKPRENSLIDVRF